MDKAAKEFLINILETPSPSGYELPVQDIVRDYVGSFADEVRTDLHGNVIASCNPIAPTARDVRRARRPDRSAGDATSTRTASSTPTRSAAGIRSSSSVSG